MEGARGGRALPGSAGLSAEPEGAQPEVQGESESWRGRAARALLAGAAALPDEVGLRLGGAIGRTWARVGAPRVRDARVNLRIAFPSLSEAERERVLVASLENLGRSLVELSWIGRRSPESLAARVRIEGDAHLEAARAAAQGAGLIVLTAHFGSWELFAAAMTAHGYPIAVVHRERDDAGLEEVLRERRTEGGAAYLMRGSAAFGVLRALRKGSFLALPFDQNASESEGVFVPFFGRLACARAAPVRLAMSARVPVLPAFMHRDRERPAEHVVHIRPALALAAGDDAEAALRENARRMTRAIEDEIRAAPEQWAWVHRRWRTQPAGEPRPPYRLPRTF